MFAYCMSGFSAAICGILVASRMSSAQPAAGNGYDGGHRGRRAGGIAISGGEGNILNTIIGALMMGVIRNGLNLIGVNSYWQQVIIGMVLVIAVANQMYRQRRSGTTALHFPAALQPRIPFLVQGLLVAPVRKPPVTIKNRRNQP